MEKAELLEKIDERYELLQAIILKNISADSEQLKLPGNWSAVDLLAHIAAWEEVLLRFHIGGETFSEVIDMPSAQYHVTSFDDINAHLLNKYSTWEEQAVIDFADKIHQQLIRKLESIPTEAYQEPAAIIIELGLDPYPLYEYVAANTFDHYDEHLTAFAVGE